MREIKFRAWWTSEKTMLHNVHLFYDTLGDGAHGNKYEPEQSFGSLLEGYDADNYIVMQYTGLKDKNGVEIYEGDIVQSDNRFLASQGLAYALVGMPLIVEYEKGCFVGMVPETKNEVTGVRNLTDQPCEVIGNIYESPELLK